ncbi:MAG: TOBE domain-containing protein [Candidatus Geothermarchaeales archaeon]
MECSESYAEVLEARSGDEVIVGIRPESVEVQNEPFEGAIETETLLEEALGSSDLLTVQVGGNMAKFMVPPAYRVRPDGKIWLGVQKDRLRFTDKTRVPGRRSSLPRPTARGLLSAKPEI